MQRPSNCRNVLRETGQAYPKSGCHHCKNGGLMGCPYDRLDDDYLRNLADPSVDGLRFSQISHRKLQQMANELLERRQQDVGS